MDKDKLYSRKDELSAVISYDFYQEKRHFSAGEKIMIMQEIGSISDKIYVIKGEMKATEARDIKISDKLEEKVQFVLKKIKNEYK